MTPLAPTDADRLVTLFRAMTDARAAAVENSSDASRLAAETAAARFEEAAREAMKHMQVGMV